MLRAVPIPLRAVKSLYNGFCMELINDLTLKITDLSEAFKMKLVFNPTCTLNSNIVSDIKMAKEAGYDGMEVLKFKLDRFLHAGFSIEDLKSKLDEFTIIGLGYVEDIERQGKGFEDVCRETERLCSIAKEINCPNVQLLTGPLAAGTAGNPMYTGVHISDEYKELSKKNWSEIRRITSKNIAVLCDLAKGYGVKFYLEMLGWTAAGPLRHGLEIIDEAGRENIGIIIDFWHMYVTDTSPDEIARLDKKLINGIHFCDSLKKPETGVIDQNLRDVYPGLGCAPIKEYLDAIKATGYDDWIAGECFSIKHTELEGYEVARTMKKYMEFALY